jgi:exosome complex component RRP42
MTPSSNQVLLSPAELSYLHTSLSLQPPIRPDARSSTQFRPLIAETDILPSTNGSARICFADGTEAIVGVKAEVEKSTPRSAALLETSATADDDDEDENTPEAGRSGENAWVEVTVEIPGFRDDDAMPVFLAALLSEALLADGEFTRRLWINSRFHWRLYVDVCISITSQFSILTSFEIDIAPLAAALISSSAAVANDAFSSIVYADPKIEVRAGRRSAV